MPAKSVSSMTDNAPARRSPGPVSPTVRRSVLPFGSMVPEVHPSSDELEAYSLGLSSDTDLEKVEEHLLICERCQNELALTDQYIRAMKVALASSQTGRRLRSIHITEDGPIFGAMHSRSRWQMGSSALGQATRWWPTCDSVEEANAYLMDSFQQMFPEHDCSEQCREELA